MSSFQILQVITQKLFFSVCNCIILCLLFAPSLLGQNTQDVLFGEVSSKGFIKENTFQIFFDKEGNIFPDWKIPDTTLQAFDGKLQTYFQHLIDVFLNCSHPIYLQPKSTSLFNAWQKSLEKEIINRIHEGLDSDQMVFVLIHGFRKKFGGGGNNSSSFRDNEFVRREIEEEAGRQGKKPFFIEVYWNAYYDCCAGLNFKKNKQIFRLFEGPAAKSAWYTGRGLRKIVSNINVNNVSIIAHSLGASVAMNTVINLPGNDSLTFPRSKTPSQKNVHICLLGPAISPTYFEYYYQRTTNFPFRDKDNYLLSIFYNNKDYVLKKRIFIFGPGPRKYGDTSLGVNFKNAIDQVEHLFRRRYYGSPYYFYPTSFGKGHHIKRYIRSKEFSWMLSSLLKS